MPTWTPSPDWGAYVADCGPYVGPWPPAPPIPANMGGGAEVHYLIVNDTLANVVTYSFGGPNLDVYRYVSGSSTAAQSGIGSAPITGGNLFVVYYLAGYAYPGTAPTMDPLSLVPALYVSGGTGADVLNPAGGHWSDWIAFPPSLASDGSVTLQQRLKTAVGAGVSSGSPSDDVLPLESTLLSNVAAGTVSASSVSAGYAQIAVAAVKNSTGATALGRCTALSIGNNATVTEAQVDLTPLGSFRLPGLLTLLQATIDPSGTLIEGVDYAGDGNHTSQQGVNFESGRTSAWDAWNSAALSCRVQGVTADGLTPTARVYDSVAVRFAAVTGASPAGWTADGAGTTLDTEIIGQTGVTSRSVALDLSAEPEAGFYVNAQIDGWSTIGAPIADWSWAGGNDEHQVGWALIVDSASATATVTYPMFRYWIPGGGPVLRTIGGHFDSISGVAVKVKLPWSGWTRIVRGTTADS